MRIAKPSDWQNWPMPDARATVALDLAYTSAEMDRIRAGLVPRVMEDKWFIYWTDGLLSFHRSWTGACIYQVRFVAEPDGCARAVEATVNREPGQYRGFEDAREAEMVRTLIALLLLHQPVAPPVDGADERERALQTWSFVGRAMLGEHPEDED